MKKRLRNKIAKQVLGVKKISVNKGDCLVVEISENMSDEQLKVLGGCLKTALPCEVIISKKKLDLTVVHGSVNK